MVKIGRLRWMGELFRMQEFDLCRKVAAGSRSLGKSKLRWLESVEEDLKKYGHEELEATAAGPRRVEDNFGRG